MNVSGLHADILYSIDLDTLRNWVESSLFIFYQIFLIIKRVNRTGVVHHFILSSASIHPPLTVNFGSL